MTVFGRLAQKRAMSIAQGGFGGWIGDPSVIPPNSAYNVGTAGVVVNERTTLALMAVSSCIRVLGDAAAGLEPRVYRMTGSRRSRQDPEVDPPQVVCNPYADIDREDGDFRLVASLGLNGNLYKHVVDRDKSGNPLQTEILNPSMVKVELVNGARVYKIGAAGTVIPAADVVHVPWISLAGGLVGVNPLEIGATGFGVAIAANEYASRYFSQGMHPTGVLSVEKPLRPEDSKRVKEELFVKQGGLAQSHTPIVLDAAAKWQQISVTPETAQLLQARSFSREELSGFYGVPAHLIGDTSDKGGPWGKGLQEMVIGFALFSLSGYTRRLDRADTRLLPAGYYTRRNVSDLFKTNDQMLGQFLSMLRQSSIATPNETRDMAGLPRSDEPGANSLFAPINSAHADFSAAGGWGDETGLPDSKNPMGVPNGTSEGGEPPVTEPEGGQ